jgi:hypothetical protein
MDARTIARATLFMGAKKILTPQVQLVVKHHHDALQEICDTPAEQIAVMMMDALSFATASVKDENRDTLRETLQLMIEEVFARTENVLARPSDAVIH